MKVWLIHHDEKIRGELDRVMPGLSWTEWNIGNSREATKAETIALQISAYLRGHASDRVSNRSIKAALGLSGTPSATFARAAKQVDAPGWQHSGQSFVRSGTAAAYGFETAN